MIVVDASVLTAYLDERDAHETAVERLLELAEKRLGCSPITPAGRRRAREHRQLEVARQAIIELWHREDPVRR